MREYNWNKLHLSLLIDESGQGKIFSSSQCVFKHLLKPDRFQMKNVLFL